MGKWFDEIVQSFREGWNARLLHEARRRAKPVPVSPIDRELDVMAWAEQQQQKIQERRMSPEDTEELLESLRIERNRRLDAIRQRHRGQ